MITREECIREIAWVLTTVGDPNLSLESATKMAEELVDYTPPQPSQSDKSE